MADLTSCAVCPWECARDRLHGEKGVCRAGLSLKVAKAYLHPWEEPCISGTRGSGTIFFSGCNLSCVFCQNYKISQERFGREISLDDFVHLCLNLQHQGAHNINLVTPAHYLLPIGEGLEKARVQGLHIPVVYNTNAYEKPESLKLLEGHVDIYLPDLKYYSDEYAWKYSGAKSYFKHATAAILEMLRQVGTPQFDEEGIMHKGLMIRHLILPGLIEDSKAILRWIAASLPHDVYVSLMGQFTPVHRAGRYPEIARSLSEAEYDEVIDYFFELGLENGFVQELEASGEAFIPEFDLSGLD